MHFSEVLVGPSINFTETGKAANSPTLQRPHSSRISETPTTFDTWMKDQTNPYVFQSLPSQTTYGGCVSITLNQSLYLIFFNSRTANYENVKNACEYVLSDLYC